MLTILIWRLVAPYTLPSFPLPQGTLGGWLLWGNGFFGIVTAIYFIRKFAMEYSDNKELYFHETKYNNLKKQEDSIKEELSFDWLILGIELFFSSLGIPALFWIFAHMKSAAIEK